VSRLNSFTARFDYPSANGGCIHGAIGRRCIECRGLGSLGIGASSVTQAQQLIVATRLLTNAPFNVKVFCHAPAQRDAIKEHAWLHHLADLFVVCSA
jgi:hypothetical protein|tara:strand:- start:70399 stop:70689 length:291 start_codon:yes stop_codon:yes gene_type:complete